jgi:hypothetical protein
LWTGSSLFFSNFQTGRPFLFTKFKMNAQQVPQCKQRRVTYLLSYIHVRNPVWIETTVCLYLLYIEIGLFLLCIYYFPWKHTSIFIFSSWQLSMEHFPLAICDFQTTFLKPRIKATEVSILATSAGYLKYWRYGKTREFRVKVTYLLSYIMSETRHG